MEYTLAQEGHCCINACACVFACVCEYEEETSFKTAVFLTNVHSRTALLILSLPATPWSKNSHSTLLQEAATILNQSTRSVKDIGIHQPCNEGNSWLKVIKLPLSAAKQSLPENNKAVRKRKSTERGRKSGTKEKTPGRGSEREREGQGDLAAAETSFKGILMWSCARAEDRE